MKKIINLFAVLTAFVAFSCSKIMQDVASSEFKVEEAQVAFVKIYNNALETKSGNSGFINVYDDNYTPIWDMCTSKENAHVWSIEVPILSDNQFVLYNKDSKTMTNAKRKLLFLKKKDTKEINAFIVVCGSTNNNDYVHLADNSEFSGFITYSTLSGKLYNLSKFSNGELVANLTPTEISSGHNHACDSEDCNHDHNSYNLDDVMGAYEFGIMPLGGEPDVFEKYCVQCGGEYPGNCICDKFEDSNAKCPDCGNGYLDCTCYSEVCGLCGKWKGLCDCDETTDYYHCSVCNNYHGPGECKYN